MASQGLNLVPVLVGTVGAGVLGLGLALGLGPTKGVVGMVVIVGALGAVAAVLRTPILGVHLVLAIGFTAMGFKRYLPQLPMGLAVDGALVLLFASVVLTPDLAKRLARFKDLAFLPIIAWVGFCFSQLFNPEARSVVAWFYAVRGLALYMILPFLAVLVLDHKKHVYGLVAHWGAWGAFAGAWGIKQSHFGVAAFEQRWLNAGAHVTHVLHGKLRAFSFLADTAQFGVTMAFTTMFFGLLAASPVSRRTRALCLVVCCFTFYGAMVSGTRSAWACVPVGLIAYAVLKRQWASTIGAVGLVLLAYGVLRFTYIGQGNYHIQRMRQVTRPLDDPSFQVRLENQKKLIPYLETHAFGGGIGSAGYWGQRFSPGTFLADLAMDSHYVRIAAETGPVGFVVFVVTMLSLAAFGFVRYGTIRDPVAQTIYGGHLAVFLGVFVASYSNQYLTQIPTAIIVYQGFALIVRGPALLDTEPPEVEAAGAPPPVRDPRRLSGRAPSPYRISRPGVAPHRLSGRPKRRAAR